MARIRIRRRKTPRDAREQSGDDVESRLAVPNFVLAAVGVVVGVLGVVFAYIGYQILATADAEVVAFEAITKDGVVAESRSPVGEVSSERIKAAAAVITLRNSGQQPALLTKVKVEIIDLFPMAGCWGAGGVETTAEYDVRVPDDIISRDPPRYVETPVKFQVEGQKIDQLAITIGPEIVYEGHWPNIYFVEIWLVDESGAEIAAGRAVLMEGGYADAIKDFAASSREEQSTVGCIAANLKLLDRALALVPRDRQSPEAATLRDELTALNLHGASNISISPQPVAPVAGEDSVNTWILQLTSFPRSLDSREVERARVDMERELGFPVKVLDSSNFASLNPGFWFLYHPGGYSDGSQALGACAANGLTSEERCVGRYLSHDARDRALICFPASSGKISRCNKE